MKVVHCRECKKEIPPTAKVCPYCRAEIPGESSLTLTIKYALFFVILAALAFALFNVGR
ncbi:zinc-ribbon domain-containing protein [Pseudomonas sp. MAP12]|uniref:Zinc-ribbon domain-containing protein n=1 Tax=Geopseudomonas aromaticivorans TaxID=2849492 RepID=A0ABS6N1Y5_9GAMM|nr:zinc-ribbon domain-containing protein [Pseudomonas aromaticivorans]MBV2135068.1 zinc-ribbon domain-containing protein [Pseudomonas aromaticivorans]